MLVMVTWQIKGNFLRRINKDFCICIIQIYRGYVDDPRNTDNAWMETIAMNFHDDKGDSVAKFKLHAGR